MTDDSPKVDKRVERSKASVIAETYRQLSQIGLANVSVDEISRISGVSKTTIYRHWPSRSALIMDACSQLGGHTETPDTGNFRNDLYLLLSELATQLQSATWSSVVPSIVDAAERDPDLLAMQREWQKGLVVPFDVVTNRAAARQEIRSGIDHHGLIAMTLGALFYRRWFSREPIDEHFIRIIVDAAVLTVQY